ncbi:MAG TPA: hypothetical protein VH640_20270 [Bryobacteraceae bacterium]|jgi:hypothetical protein
MWKAAFDRYRFPERLIEAGVVDLLSIRNRAARFGAGLPNTIAASVDPASDLAEYFTHERYVANHAAGSPEFLPDSVVGQVYYALRPFLPKRLRILLQRAYLSGWDNLAFPAWPVDFTVEHLLEAALVECMKSAGIESLPFIWFWPDGASAAVIITHDVETCQGRDFSSCLMGIDESFEFRSSFQIIPEKRYSVADTYLQEIRDRGHEINVQDLNHDGKLFRERDLFLSRVRKINEYGRAWGAKGFRAAVLYRNLNWYDSLEFEYDMSVPNVAHLEPQRGGCCTTFPYFIGEILELPITTTQDYSLLHILRQQKIGLWKTQAGMILDRHGLLHFVTHPDYLLETRAQNLYRELLAFLAEICGKRQLWSALPGQINKWWRMRSQMILVRLGSHWHIQGPGAERARVAHAHLEGGRLTYSVENLVPANP